MIRSISANGTQVYHLSAGRSLPDFIKETKPGKSARQSKERRHLELIQDFQFPVSSTKVSISSDGNYIGAVGIYPPELRVFDTSQLSVKFSRGFDCEIVDFRFLSDDYRKLVLLHADRTIEFHAQGGRHHKLRIPFVGRHLSYVSQTAELLAVGSSPDILRIDLEAGIFEEPIPTGCETINACVTSPTLPVVFVGGAMGRVEAYDTRSWRPASTLTIPGAGSDLAVSALDVSSNGLNLCVGTSDGVCRVYDIRSSHPLAERDHRNGLPIVDLKFASKSKTLNLPGRADLTVVSADTKTVKIWDVESHSRENRQASTRLVASIDAKLSDDEAKSEKEQPPGAINSIALYPESGLIFVAQDNPRIGVYFVTALGLAPKWCSFLDSLTEELEETPKDHVYEDFQFVTREALQQLGAEHLIGTPLLRAYMHGYFMDGRLYQKLKVVSQSEMYEELRKKRIQERIASKRTMRLQVRQKLRPVNKDLAARLEERASGKTKSADTAKELLTDERFTQLFTNPNFAIESVPLNGAAAASLQVDSLLAAPLQQARRDQIKQQ